LQQIFYESSLDNKVGLKAGIREIKFNKFLTQTIILGYEPIKAFLYFNFIAWINAS
jgi:hypothetical protein